MANNSPESQIRAPVLRARGKPKRRGRARSNGIAGASMALYYARLRETSKKGNYPDPVGIFRDGIVDSTPRPVFAPYRAAPSQNRLEVPQTPLQAAGREAWIVVFQPRNVELFGAYNLLILRSAAFGHFAFWLRHPVGLGFQIQFRRRKFRCSTFVFTGGPPCRSAGASSTTSGSEVAAPHSRVATQDKGAE
jgi:hypothetical protein